MSAVTDSSTDACTIRPPTLAPPLLVNIKQACQILGLGRTTLYHRESGSETCASSSTRSPPTMSWHSHSLRQPPAARAGPQNPQVLHRSGEPMFSAAPAPFL